MLQLPGLNCSIYGKIKRELNKIQITLSIALNLIKNCSNLNKYLTFEF